MPLPPGAIPVELVSTSLPFATTGAIVIGFLVVVSRVCQTRRPVRASSAKVPSSVFPKTMPLAVVTPFGPSLGRANRARHSGCPSASERAWTLLLRSWTKTAP